MENSKVIARRQKRLPGKPDGIIHLNTQAIRARRMAAECGSQLVADLFEIHAQVCERNADRRQSRLTKFKP